MNLMSGNRRRGLYFIILFTLIFITGCENLKQSDSVPVELKYMVLNEESITLSSNLSGRVSALVSAEVRPRVGGIITERFFEEGSKVKKGQVLYRIDSALYKTAYEIAKANLAEAKSQVKSYSLLEYRHSVLASKEAISRQQLDDITFNHEQSRARLARAEAELEQAAINLAYTEVMAPVDGYIGASFASVGALVTANQENALAVIKQTDRVYVDMQQSNMELIRLRRALAQGRIISENNKGNVYLYFEDGSAYTALAEHEGQAADSIITGKLQFAELSVGQDTGNTALRAVFNNPEGLLVPGMYVRAVIEEGIMNNAILIPQKAVFVNNNGGHSVYVLCTESMQHGSDNKVGENGFFQVERRDVRIGRSFGNRWLVESGLQNGDLLVVEGLQKAVPGSEVKAVPVTNKETGNGYHG